MNSYRRRIQQLHVRMVMSAVLYIGFLIAAVSGGRIDRNVGQGELGIMLLLLLGAMLLLPRSAMPPGRAVAPRNEAEADEQFVQRSRLRHLTRLALYIRLFYFAMALFVLFVVPRLFGGIPS